jgi:hypothetical protein
MDARTIELNRIGDLLKNAFDGRYNNEPLSNHQKPVSVVPNRDFALKQFEFAKIAKKPISQTLVQKPADFDSYWSESTINLIRKLVKEREQYKQNSELVKTQLNDKSSDAAKDAEIVKLKQELKTFETMKKMNEEMNKLQSQLTIENKKLKIENEELQKSKYNYKEMLDKNAIQKFIIDNANAKLSKELKECNEDLGKCNKDNNDMKVKIYDCNLEKQHANEDADLAAKWTQDEVEKNEKLTKQLQQKNAEFEQLQQKNAEFEQLQQNSQTAENKFKLEKAQMDIMFGMKMDLIKKQHEHSMQDAIANISNSSNADLIKQIDDLTNEKQTYQQTYKQTIDDFNETIRKNKEDNKKLSNDLIQAQNTNETQKQAMLSHANPDKAKLAQLQTRVINLTRELLIIKMNEDLQRQKNANFKPTKSAAQTAPTKLDRKRFTERDHIELDMKGGAPKQKLFMKGGASKEFAIDFDEDEEILVIFNKNKKSVVFQTPDVPEMTYCTVDEIKAYNKKLKELKDKIDALTSSLPTPSVAIPDSDTMNKLTAKLIALQTLYKNLQNNLMTEKIKNASNLSIQSTLKSSLTNATAIAVLTKEKDDLKAENAVLTKEKAGLEAEKAGLEAEKAGLEAEKAALEGEKTILESAKTILESEKTTLESAKAALEGEKTALEGAKTTLESAKAALEGEKTALEGEKTTLEAENSSLKTTNANLTNQLNATSTASGMSTAISTANATLRRNPKVFISDNGRVMFSEHK